MINIAKGRRQKAKSRKQKAEGRRHEDNSDELRAESPAYFSVGHRPTAKSANAIATNFQFTVFGKSKIVNLKSKILSRYSVTPLFSYSITPLFSYSITQNCRHERY